MSGAFDPYLKWLAILPEEQPPNHYRLLGVPLFLDDSDVIENAVHQRMAHVRTFSTGEHSELSQKILNEISTAEIILLDPEKKSVYDEQLRSAQAPQTKSTSTPKPPVEQEIDRPSANSGEVDSSWEDSEYPVALEPPPQLKRSTFAQSTRGGTNSARVSQKSQKQKRKNRQPMTKAVAAVLLLALVVGVVLILNRNNVPDVADGEVNRGGQVGNSGNSRPDTERKQTKLTENGRLVSHAVTPDSVGGSTPTEVKPVPVAASRYALRFAEEDYVELKGSRDALDLTQPFTAELWLRLTDVEKTSFLFGDHCWGMKNPDDPEMGASGWALQVRHNKGTHSVGIQYATGRGSATHSLGPLPDPGDRWHHLAVCSTEEVARVYVDGKFSKTHPSIVQRIRPGYCSLYLGGLEFTLKRLCFEGDIRAFRLSTVERYTSDFEAPEIFELDADTISLLDFSRKQPAEINDLAGKYSGRISGGKWIRVDDSIQEDE